MVRPLDDVLDRSRNPRLTIPRQGTPAPYNTGVVPPGFGQPAPPPPTVLQPTQVTATQAVQPPAVTGPAPLDNTAVPQVAVPQPAPVPATPAPQTPAIQPLDPSAFVAQVQPRQTPAGNIGVPQSGYQGGVVDVGVGTSLPAAQASGDVVQGYLDDLLSTDNSYIRNAVLRGQELANARGLGNSSIAAGASQRAAIESAMPILNNILALNESREGRSFAQDESRLARQLEAELQAQGFSFQDAQNAAQRALNLTQSRESNALASEEGALNRAQSVNNAVLGARLEQERAAQDFEFRRTLQSDQVAQQDWLSTNAFNREFNAGLSMIPITNASQLNSMIAQYAMENPEVYTPEIAAGMTNFFTQNFMTQMAQYFPDLFVEGGA